MSEEDNNLKLSENLTAGERSREGPGNQPEWISGSITAEENGGLGYQSGGYPDSQELMVRVSNEN
jgi:hypothetical protein